MISGLIRAINESSKVINQLLKSILISADHGIYVLGLNFIPFIVSGVDELSIDLTITTLSVVNNTMNLITRVYSI